MTINRPKFRRSHDKGSSLNCNSIPVLFGFGFRPSLIEITWRILRWYAPLPRCKIALHGRDVYDHAITVVNFDPLTLAIISVIDN